MRQETERFAARRQLEEEGAEGCSAQVRAGRAVKSFVSHSLIKSGQNCCSTWVRLRQGSERFERTSNGRRCRADAALSRRRYDYCQLSVSVGEM